MTARTACTDSDQNAARSDDVALRGANAPAHEEFHLATPTGRLVWLGVNRHGAVEVRAEGDGYVLWLTVGAAPPLRYAAGTDCDPLWQVGVRALEGLRHG